FRQALISIVLLTSIPTSFAAAGGSGTGAAKPRYISKEIAITSETTMTTGAVLTTITVVTVTLQYADHIKPLRVIAEYDQDRVNHVKRWKSPPDASFERQS